MTTTRTAERKVRLWKIAAALGASILFGPPSVGQQSLDDLLKKGVVTPGKKPAAAQQPVSKGQTAAPAKKAATPAGGQKNQAVAATSGAFRMDLPPGWRAQMGQNGAVVAAGQGDLAVVIAPVLDAGEVAAGTWLQRAGASAVAKYLRDPTITGIYPSRMGTSAALASFDYGGGEGAANALCLINGGIGTLYIIAGPKAVFLQQRPGLVQMLKTFSFSGEARSGGESAQTSRAGFINFQDPAEKAFTIDVPAGWKVEGGLVRKSAMDFRNYVWATSPDGFAFIRLRDPAYGTFMIPDPTHESLGVREGMNYTVGLGLVELVLRYIPGPDFARQYAAKLAADLQATGLQVTAVNPRPDLSKTETAPAPGPYAPQVQVTAAEAEFTCTRNGQPYAGKVVAATRLDLFQDRNPILGNTNFGHWSIKYLGSYLTPQERLRDTDQIFRHMLDSVQFSAEWGRMQGKLAFDAAQANRGVSEYRARVFDEVHQNRERSEERIHQNRIDSIRGVVRLKDPNTGEELEGVAGRNYYYRAPGGRAVGADREIRSPDFTELEQIR